MQTRKSAGGSATRRLADRGRYDTLVPEWAIPLLDARTADEARTPSATPEDLPDGGAASALRSLADDIDRASTADPPDTTGERLPKLDKQCRTLLALLRRHCPDIIPTGPVPPGEVTPPIEVGNDDLGALVLTAIGVDDKRRKHQVVWDKAGSELLVHLKKTRLAVLEGMILVGVTVESVETGQVEVTVPFAVGNSERLAGMEATTEPLPRGPSLIVDTWGDAIVAFAWQALVDVITAFCNRTGVDTAGGPLVPGAIVASPSRLQIIPQARHQFERVRRP